MNLFEYLLVDFGSDEFVNGLIGIVIKSELSVLVDGSIINEKGIFIYN